ncbi:hypothetical protein HDG34_003117 [Paraburkholderia sp. HC6.4b]|nr:hypothetical protein [Paraburkholderia sp. HC6.4b]MBB5450904.1 hypothetical protein [Paraburkholderia sp. Kb1A]
MFVSYQSVGVETGDSVRATSLGAPAAVLSKTPNQTCRGSVSSLPRLSHEAGGYFGALAASSGLSARQIDHPWSVR